MNGTASNSSGNSQPRRRTKVFRDPIHDLITLGPEDQWVLKLIDTKEFQRLRRIRQLGLAHFVYPGAEHTRFVHSLGVFNFARRMIDKLVERHRDDAEIRDQIIENSASIKAAALLHDIGHGPFSHVYERVFEVECSSFQKHENRSCEILRDPETEIGQALSRINDCDDGVKVDIQLICSLISDEEDPPPEHYLKDIVSSQLDADRMDYLLRDSLMTGSRYGQFDSEWILNSLAIGDPGLGMPSDKKLCLDQSKGIGAVEGLLFARLLMYHYVYGHKTIRAYEAELIQTLRLALLLKDVLPSDTPQPVLDVLVSGGDVPIRAYLLLDDEVMWWALRRWAVWENVPEVAGDLAGALKRHALRLVRRHTPWRTKSLIGKPIFLAKNRLVADLEDRSDPLRFECYLDDLATVPYKPYKRMKREGKQDLQAIQSEICLIDCNQEVEFLSDSKSTHIVEALKDDHGICRFHYDPKFSREFAGPMKKFGVC